MGKAAHVGGVELHIGAKGRSVLPAPVRRAAQVAEGDRVIARAEGRGRIVLETPDAIRERVWAAAPRSQDTDATADVRAMRDEDNGISDANFMRRSEVADPENAEAIGQRLLAKFGL